MQSRMKEKRRETNRRRKEKECDSGDFLVNDHPCPCCREGLGHSEGPKGYMSARDGRQKAGHGAGRSAGHTKKLDDVSVSAPRHEPHLSVVILRPTRALVSSYASKAGDRDAHPPRPRNGRGLRDSAPRRRRKTYAYESPHRTQPFGFRPRIPRPRGARMCQPKTLPTHQHRAPCTVDRHRRIHARRASVSLSLSSYGCAHGYTVSPRRTQPRFRPRLRGLAHRGRHPDSERRDRLGRLDTRRPVPSYRPTPARFHPTGQEHDGMG
ncbi:hypothetical protein B0H16DRAFT_223894 [Mycena metata]|uniref:Uncharacterized protein n=1 Tax=Mycena metata TaxID=1033252 RepID=A0AAD7HWK4_9AGAR|nr:hypothetical protein B0H16DRAFT_223894 [Mycena metata]